MKIIVATRNKGKVDEFQAMLGRLGYEVESLLDYETAPETDETGSTFEENAELKSREAAAYFGHSVLSDDSGLEVDALNGAPGVYSARFAGEDKSDEANNALLLEKLADVPAEQRTARFVCALSLAKPSGETLTVRGTMEGTIGFELKGANGFGYDPLFIIPSLNQTAAELTKTEKAAISHRGQALQKLEQALTTFLGA
ncbi:XTP/dITP diphosphatase [Exiguobacterium antarcticum]|uniref:dITP/XTP pyrophosphatase n=1 Tax=Exiguobacterium antarcticum TaxID=132920 RepID=A0ABT6R3P2_9BACL|nr:XTP/dITP diphosphatase [Exiguobacterium antarcticum]AFS71104.1 Non-canonical purine NTP pyrophosphatase [Exiguobacterium antarcticum B7]MDI3235567.1 XTP/dITP diphosphatase [Exiguobacterium antarcticum]